MNSVQCLQAIVLEYWLDVSRFSQWKRPGAKLPWRRDVLEADAQTYARLGLRHVTTFAVWIDADYVKRFGEPSAIQEYGETCASSRWRSAGDCAACASFDETKQ